MIFVSLHIFFILKYVHHKYFIMESDNTLTATEYNDLRARQMPWIEKYRPKKIENIILPDNLKHNAERIVKTKNLPNLILTGPPGIGKTTSIRCIARELYGEHYKKCVIELNASDDRGIRTMSELYNFCKSVSFKNSRQNKDPTFCKYKLIIMDEADNMLDKAQHQLNKLMEDYKDTVRFAFTCNSSADIIEAVQSRCIILRYMRLSVDQLAGRLTDICKIEKTVYEPSAVKQIAEMSRGDMRQAINILQLVHNKHNDIKLKYIESVCDMPQPVSIKKIFDKCNERDLREAVKLALALKHEGYSGSDITLGMIYTIKSELCIDIPESVKISMLEKICYGAYNISKGVDSNLQLLSYLAELAA